MTSQNPIPPGQEALQPSPQRFRSRRQPGDRNIAGYGFDFHPEVFLVSAGLILLFVIVTLVFREPAENA
ncbi:MAG: hypothetical protein MJA27_35455, partial [Pseudanabaenales cyanobacterium]|nr:hypothetical protein [Pseudanabaenales cyanobacterium]